MIFLLFSILIIIINLFFKPLITSIQNKLPLFVGVRVPLW